MKTLICAVLLGLVTLVALLFQRTELETLRQQTQALEASIRKRAADVAPQVNGYRRRNQSAAFRSEQSVERLRKMVNLSFEMLLNPGSNLAQHPEFWNLRNSMIPELVKVDHQSAFNILNESLDIPGIAKEERDRLIEGYVRIYTDANPLEALRLIELLADYPEFTKQLVTAYLRSAITKPGHAVAWFDEQSRAGNPITENPEIIRASLTAQSRVDPTRAASRMVDLPASEETTELGYVLVQEFRNIAEHLAFARALEHEVAKNPASSSLSEIRKQYAKALVSRLDDWPFDEAVLLIDGCLTPEERLQTARKLMFFEKDQDAGKWAGWLASFELADNKTHPLSSYIGNWAINDPAAAMNWLENSASGTAKELGIIGYANYMAEKDPHNAMKLLGALPESKQRSNTIQRVRERWRKVDPAAEADFNMDQVPENQ